MIERSQDEQQQQSETAYPRERAVADERIGIGKPSMLRSNKEHDAYADRDQSIVSKIFSERRTVARAGSAAATDRASAGPIPAHGRYQRSRQR